MKIAIIQFPGSNCEAESIRAVKQAGMDAEEFLWNHDYRNLEQYDGYFLVGGFSYEDRSRAGIIAALDPVMDVIRLEAKKGKPVLGICNGAQILVETGMVPGLSGDALGMALAVNQQIKQDRVVGTGFYNAWVWMKLDHSDAQGAFTRSSNVSTPIRIPVAHGEGKFVMPEPILAEMIAQRQTPFRYCDANGNIQEEFPVNPNGAMYNLAAVTNPRGNVMAMMPHPERTPDGWPIFTSMREYIAQEQHVRVSINNGPSSVSPAVSITNTLPAHYRKPLNTIEIIVDLIITDNTASTVRNTLDQLEIHANIKRYTHWEIEAEPTQLQPALEEEILQTTALFNPKKEYQIHTLSGDTRQCIFLLIRDKPDTIGQAKTELMQKRFLLEGLRHITRGTLWKISIERGNIDVVLEHIFRTNILYNPYAQECLFYTTNS